MLGLKLLGLAIATMLSSGKTEAQIQNMSIYPLTTIVTEVHEEEIVVVDFNGNEWIFDNEAKDWFEGDIASLIMCDNGTETIYDDFILYYEYDGWVEDWE